MSLHSYTLSSDSESTSLSGEATNTNFIVFGFTRPRLEPTIYRTRSEHDNQYATDAVQSNPEIGRILTELKTRYNRLQVTHSSRRWIDDTFGYYLHQRVSVTLCLNNTVVPVINSNTLSWILYC